MRGRGGGGEGRGKEGEVLGKEAVDGVMCLDAER
jgi:hypothetical protein